MIRPGPPKNAVLGSRPKGRTCINGMPSGRSKASPCSAILRSNSRGALSLRDPGVNLLFEAVLVKLRPIIFIENYQLIFDRPLFDWSGVMQSFFDLIFKRVGARIPVKVNEF